MQTWHPPTLANEAVLPETSPASVEDYDFVIFIVVQPTPQQKLKGIVSLIQRGRKEEWHWLMILGNRRNKRTLAGTLEDSLIFGVIVAHFKRAGDGSAPVALRLMRDG